MKKQPTVKSSEISYLAMTTGGERKFTKVIVGDRVHEWVGIGWIDIGPLTLRDLKRYPVVVDG